MAKNVICASFHKIAFLCFRKGKNQIKELRSISVVKVNEPGELCLHRLRL